MPPPSFSWVLSMTTSPPTSPTVALLPVPTAVASRAPKEAAEVSDCART